MAKREVTENEWSLLQSVILGDRDDEIQRLRFAIELERTSVDDIQAFRDYLEERAAAEVAIRPIRARLPGSVIASHA